MRRFQIPAGIDPAALQAVNQVICTRHSLHGSAERGAIMEISLDHLDLVPPGIATQASYIPDQAAHAVTLSEKLGDQSSTHITGCTGHQNALGHNVLSIASAMAQSQGRPNPAPMQDLLCQAEQALRGTTRSAKTGGL